MLRPKFTLRIKTKAQRQSDKAGYPPGTVVYVGQDREHEPHLSAMSYETDQERLKVEDNLSLQELAHLPRPQHTAWLNVDGVHRTELIKAIGERFHIHPLTQEDIANTQQRPKAEEFENYLFVLLKMVSFEPETEAIHIEQVSLLLSDHLVVTFQEETQDVFDPVRERLQVPGTRLRRHQADYLFFALIDVIISNYFFVTEQISSRITELEAEIVEEIDEEALTDLQHLRKSLQELQRAIIPLREAIAYCMRSDGKLIDPSTMVYFQELSDQISQVIDALNSEQDSLNNLQALYLALASQKTNEVMKVLTIISTIFLPLSFLAGIYGMNFDYMPELHWEHSYYVLWGFNLLLIGSMLAYFRYKDWI